MRSKHRCLLAIDVFEFTGDEIGKMRKEYSHDRYLDSVLPKYTFNKGKIVDSDGFFQFLDKGKEKFILFDYKTVDRLLAEEISACGFQRLFEDVDIVPYLDKFKKHNYKTFGKRLESSEYLIVELEYTGGGYYGDDNFDLNVGIVGALTGNYLDVIEIKEVNGK